MSDAAITISSGNTGLMTGTNNSSHATSSGGSSGSASSSAYLPFYYGVNSTAFKTFWADVQTCCQSSEVSFPMPSLEAIRQSAIDFMSKAGGSMGLGSSGREASFTKALSQIYQGIHSKMASLNLDSLAPFTVLPFSSITVNETELSFGAEAPSVFSFLAEQIGVSVPIFQTLEELSETESGQQTLFAVCRIPFDVNGTDLKQNWSCLTYKYNDSIAFWPLFPCPNTNPVSYPYMIHYVAEGQTDFYSCGGGSLSNEVLSFTKEMLPSLSLDNSKRVFQGWFQDAEWTKPLKVGERFFPRAISAYPKWIDITTTAIRSAPMQFIWKGQNGYEQIYIETSSDIIRRPHSKKAVEASLQSLEAEVASLKQQLADLTNGNEVGY